MVYRYKEVKTIFQQEGWTNYFDIMKGEDVVIAMEFMRTYDNAVADVQGLKVQADELTIERVFGLPQIDERWFERRMPMNPHIDEFLEPN